VKSVLIERIRETVKCCREINTFPGVLILWLTGFLKPPSTPTISIDCFAWEEGAGAPFFSLGTGIVLTITAKLTGWRLAALGSIVNISERLSHRVAFF
jgi:hypothetical protein